MTIKYPNGKKYNGSIANQKPSLKKTDYSNRGMTLEEDINETNLYYLSHGIAAIHKKPTPLQIVQVDYPKRSAAVVKEAYFRQPSTTDYNGVYKGKHIDFEAKETRNKTSFPLQNFHDHQINHMKAIVSHQGICFVLLRFTTYEETYLLDAKRLIYYYEKMETGRKSIPKKEIEEHGHFIALNFQPRIDYLHIVDTVYF